MDIDKIKLVIFDCDETLVQAPDFYRQYGVKLERSVADILGISVRSAKLAVDSVRKDHNGMGELIFPKLGYSLDVWHEKILEIEPSKFLNRDPKLTSFIKSLNLKKIIISNAPSEQVIRVIEAKGLSVNDFIKVVGWKKGKRFPKPSSTILRKILEDLGLNPHNALMVGNNYKIDLAPAKEINMATAIVGKDKRADIEIETIYELKFK
jgi:FMN phosphatase YigB (HAD superfamily)